MFFLAEHHDAVDMLVQVPEEKIHYTSIHVIEEIPTHERQEYFEYVRLTLDWPQPNTWQDALELFENLVNIAEYGS